MVAGDPWLTAVVAAGIRSSSLKEAVVVVKEPG